MPLRNKPKGNQTAPDKRGMTKSCTPGKTFPCGGACFTIGKKCNKPMAKDNAKKSKKVAIAMNKTDDEKRLDVPGLQQALFDKFGVKSVDGLRKSGAFKMATDGMFDKPLNKSGLNEQANLEKMYRKVVGILPHEQNEKGYGVVNGINVFKYFKPWQMFGLDPQKATKEDVKKAYRELSKVYHPDKPTGDVAIFEQVNIAYKSLTAEA